LVFGNDTSGYQDETTARCPIYPYGASKNYTDDILRMFREKYGLFGCSGIFFNHESPRRGDNFFSKKVINAVKEKKKIKVGDITQLRDMGYAGDFVEAAHMMLQHHEPDDYVVGTGRLISMEYFAEYAFGQRGLGYRDYLEPDESLFRVETKPLRANTTKINNILGWKPTLGIEDIINKMLNE
jgi:GDPmannose 4,6-dehydratase